MGREGKAKLLAPHCNCAICVSCILFLFFIQQNLESPNFPLQILLSTLQFNRVLSVKMKDAVTKL